MKAQLLGMLMLAGCASAPELSQTVRMREEAYLYARASYQVTLEQMVEYKDDCLSRPPELVAECKPVVDRMRSIATDGISYRKVMEAAYQRGDMASSESSLNGLRLLQSALKRELILQAQKEKAQ